MHIYLQEQDCIIQPMRIGSSASPTALGFLQAEVQTCSHLGPLVPNIRLGICEVFLRHQSSLSFLPVKASGACPLPLFLKVLGPLLSGPTPLLSHQGPSQPGPAAIPPSGPLTSPLSMLTALGSITSGNPAKVTKGTPKRGQMIQRSCHCLLLCSSHPRSLPGRMSQ